MSEELVYQCCPRCEQQYFNKPKVLPKDKHTKLCKLCLEDALLEEDEWDDEIAPI